MAWLDRPAVKLPRVSCYPQYLTRGGLDLALHSRWEIITVLVLVVVIFYSPMRGHPLLPQLSDALTLAMVVTAFIFILTKSIGLSDGRSKRRLGEAEYRARLKTIRAFGPIGDIEAWHAD